MDSNLCLNNYSIYVTHLLNFTNPMPIGQLFDFIHHIYHKISSLRIQNEDKSQYYAIFEDYLKADFTRTDGKYLQQVVVLVNYAVKLGPILELAHLIQKRLHQEDQTTKTQ